MIADMPPAIACVAADQVQSIEVVLKGKLDALAEALADMRKTEPNLDLAVSNINELEPEQTAIIRFEPHDPYRKIGGLIYTAQLRGVNVITIANRPPVCSDIKR